MKKKTELYLPLQWCRNMKKQISDTLVNHVSTEDILRLTTAVNTMNSEKKAEEIKNFCRKYPKFANLIQTICYLDSSGRMSAKELWDETIKDLLSMANIMEWTLNKQVFRFDKDFLEELEKPENLVISKDVWDYLPYNNFYVDISENQELCQKIAGKGFFVSVIKRNADEVVWRKDQKKTETAYEVHLCKVEDKFFYTDTLTIPNEEYDCTVDGSEETEIDRHDIVRSNDGRLVSSKTNIKVNTKVYQTVVVQILNYLASIEPDIEENEETKQTYRQPSEKTETNVVNTTTNDKFSEIRKWDVGVRYGTAFRKWKKEQSTAESKPNGKHTGKRPHSRKAHWHKYWYGSGDNKYCRYRWLGFMLINADKEKKTGKSPVTIHQCS